jgi:hypothetical protein
MAAPFCSPVVDSVHVATMQPSREAAIALRGPDRRLRASVHVCFCTSHTRMQPSTPPLMMLVPSRLKITACTAPTCPRSSRTIVQVCRRDQSRGDSFQCKMRNPSKGNGTGNLGLIYDGGRLIRMSRRSWDCAESRVLYGMGSNSPRTRY